MRNSIRNGRKGTKFNVIKSDCLTSVVLSDAIKAVLPRKFRVSRFPMVAYRIQALAEVLGYDADVEYIPSKGGLFIRLTPKNTGKRVVIWVKVNNE